MYSPFLLTALFDRHNYLESKYRHQIQLFISTISIDFHDDTSLTLVAHSMGSMPHDTVIDSYTKTLVLITIKYSYRWCEVLCKDVGNKTRG